MTNQAENNIKLLTIGGITSVVFSIIISVEIVKQLMNLIDGGLSKPIDGYSGLVLGSVVAFTFFILGGMIILKKQIPTWFKYLSVTFFTFWAMELNLSNQLSAYKSRGCSSPLIDECPLVSSEIKLLFFWRVLIYTAGLALIYWVHQSSKKGKKDNAKK